MLYNKQYISPFKSLRILYIMLTDANIQSRHKNMNRQGGSDHITYETKPKQAY